MWADDDSDDLIIAAAHEKWKDARDHMHHLIKSYKSVGGQERRHLLRRQAQSSRDRRAFRREHIPLTHRQRQTRPLVDEMEDWERPKEPEVPGSRDQQQAHLGRPRA
jgi:hypothetical protein